MSPASPPTVPTSLQERRLLGPVWGSWLDRLPRLAATLLDEWQLTVDGDAMHGWCSLVLPVLTAEGREAVLKIGFDGDDESLHEPQALTRWNGDGAVRLLRADPRRRALVLERLRIRDLTAVPVTEAGDVLATLYRRLHRPAGPPFPTVTDVAGTWLDDLQALGPDVPLPRSLRAQALSLGRDLLADPPGTPVLLHGDLHWENVLAVDDAADGSSPDRWRAIDPKPMVGDIHLEPAPLVWNRWQELQQHRRGPRAGIRERLSFVTDATGLDHDRVRDWFLVRVVLNAASTVADARRASRALTDLEQRGLTWCVTMAKAVQD
ncbi:streptomycin 6-kinase [Tersicoccus solisilvae]|uniref:Streptomycin 6-kinase n=1 Tax=Tersicoccus solisilvae TaxID=1882339 RepID=A0ABQ1PQ36_9MICC|nr:aminoglycoside phosphotransferase family protein [Tersicoccus solisilvae]GGD00777.1 streptomycin 6-kinase [Tersicoccus solisilvae]